MKYELEDFNINESNISIISDNTLAICLTKNPILHSRAKYMEMKNHFIRAYVQKWYLDIKFVGADHHWADIFTKSLVEDKFNFIKKILTILVIKKC